MNTCTLQKWNSSSQGPYATKKCSLVSKPTQKPTPRPTQKTQKKKAPTKPPKKAPTKPPKKAPAKPTMLTKLTVRGDNEGEGSPSLNLSPPEWKETGLWSHITRVLRAFGLSL